MPLGVRSGRASALCDTEGMAIPRLPTADPKDVTVNVTTGTGVEIAWQDGHRSSYTFPFLRDACPCAVCEEEREKAGRSPGEAPTPGPGALPIFKPAARPSAVEPVGKYAIRFNWNDGHSQGIYSWDYLRWICPCPECTAKRKESPRPPKP